MENYFGNKCYGCMHYDGFFNWDDSRTLVNCSLGHKVRISLGCSSFTPDNTANCYECFYSYSEKHGTIDRPKCQKGNTRTMTNSIIEYCYDFARRAEETENKNKGGCFLTTACIESAGLPDNCTELTTLRHFRDEYILKLTNGQEMIAKYYNNAPIIVQCIDSEPNPKAQYEKIFTTIQEAVKYIIKNDNEKAIKIYIELFLRLSSTYLKKPL